MIDVIILGAGPAGVLAALRAADLGARTVLISRAEFGGMAAMDGPVPVRTLAHVARLLRDARQFSQYGIRVGQPVLDYAQLLTRVREVVNEVREHSYFRQQLDSLGVTIYEHAGKARLTDRHIVETESGLKFEAEKIIICTGGISRRLPIPGFELTCTHSDAWSLTSVPPSMLVVGAGDTGIQVASIFNAFGSKVQIFQVGPRILPSTDKDISSGMTTALRESGITVHTHLTRIEGFEKTASGVRMTYSRDGGLESAEAALSIVAVGWVADTEGLNLDAANVETDQRGFIKVDEYLRTSTGHIFAAGDVTGRVMLVPHAIQDAFVAATNAARGPIMTAGSEASPVGSFTDPEYGQVGLSEEDACLANDAITAVLRFDSTARTIIDGRKTGFCKLIADRKTFKIFGCHVVGERAVEIAQVAATAIAGDMRVDQLARIPLSFPTYAGILARVAASATRELNRDISWQGNQVA
jgi:pyruvate/2-oxoglutarate dehydrogenase complex dihydrolipoamide dehydrogenase (E3) component